MKTKISLILCAFLLLIACNKKVSDTKNKTEVSTEENKVEKVSKQNSSETIKDCDDFLNTYEKWTGDLITLMAKYKDDPVTLATSPEYMDTMMKGMNFSKQWVTISTSCSTDDTYSKRMKEIQQRMEEKQKELGIK